MLTMQPIFHYLESVDSTNNEIKRRVERSRENTASESSVPAFTVISAGEQTAGRGRSGHNWVSPAGTSVSTSMLLCPREDEVSAERVSFLTILAAMGVADAVEELYPLTPQIKWVNDVLINGKKICGILTERVMLRADGNARDDATAQAGLATQHDALVQGVAASRNSAYIVVGIGVNVHQTSFPDEIADKATSLDLELREIRASRKAVTETIWAKFLSYYKLFLQTDTKRGENPIISAYNRRLINRDKPVRVLDPVSPFDGIAKGIDESGALIVQTADGQLHAISSGEVSVRGIDGYI